MLTTSPAHPVTLGVSLKMYFGHERTLAWTREIARIAGAHPAVRSGAVEVFILPSYPAIVQVLRAVEGTAIRVGAQDVAQQDPGPYTGEVSAAELREIGCALAEVGHAERRRLFGEDDAMVAGKTAAALRSGLTPVICIGESRAAPSPAAAAEVVAQLDAALAQAPDGPVIAAYEPVWAIGAAEPAPDGHIVAVLEQLRIHLDSRAERSGSRVIYGGSAGPGLLARNGGRIEGLFLGRFVHDPTAFGAVLDEAAALVAERGQVA